MQFLILLSLPPRATSISVRTASVPVTINGQQQTLIVGEGTEASDTQRFCTKHELRPHDCNTLIKAATEERRRKWSSPTPQPPPEEPNDTLVPAPAPDFDAERLREQRIRREEPATAQEEGEPVPRWRQVWQRWAGTFVIIVFVGLLATERRERRD